MMYDRELQLVLNNHYCLMFSIVFIREDVVHYKRFKSPIRFSTYQELMEKIERDEKWLIDLKFSYFRIFYEVNQNLHEFIGSQEDSFGNWCCSVSSATA